MFALAIALPVLCSTLFGGAGFAIILTLANMTATARLIINFSITALHASLDAGPGIDSTDPRKAGKRKGTSAHQSFRCGILLRSGFRTG